MKLSENQNFPKQIQRENVPGWVHACKEKDFPGGYMERERFPGRVHACKEKVFPGEYMQRENFPGRAPNLLRAGPKYFIELLWFCLLATKECKSKHFLF
jgi:hypothetical protein